MLMRNEMRSRLTSIKKNDWVNETNRLMEMAFLEPSLFSNGVNNEISFTGNNSFLSLGKVSSFDANDFSRNDMQVGPETIVLGKIDCKRDVSRVLDFLISELVILILVFSEF